MKSIVIDRAQKSEWWDFEITRAPMGMWAEPNLHVRVDDFLAPLYKLGCDWFPDRRAFWVPRISAIPFTVWIVTSGYRTRRTP